MKKKSVKNEQSLPGYPHYPASEDITSNEKRIDKDIEDLTQPSGTGNTATVQDSTPDIVPGTEADVTKEDLIALGDPQKDNDGGDDETILPHIKLGPDFTGDDLDVPGSELDDDAESRGSEDEENNYYSRGQD